MQKKYPFELSSLKSSNVPIAKVQKGDVVRIADSDLDYLRDFYNKYYDGKPFKLFSQMFAISVLNDVKGALLKKESIIFFVRSIDEGNFIQVDMFEKSLGDMVAWTVVIDNTHQKYTKDGKFYMETYAIEHNGPGLSNAPNTVKERLTVYCSDVVQYVLFFMQENLNNPEYVTKKTEEHSEGSINPVKKKKKKNAKKKVVRSTIYVPKRIISENESTTDKASVTDGEEGNKDENKKTEKRGYTGHIEEWKARGYKRRLVSKDGTVRYVDVKPSIRKRNPKLMAKGQEKGVDIKLRYNKNK